MSEQNELAGTPADGQPEAPQAQAVETLQAEQPAHQQVEETATEGEPKAEPSHDTGWQKRVNKLTAEKYQLRNEVEQLKEQFATIKQPESVIQSQAAPTIEQFDYDQDKYNQAMIDYKVQDTVNQRIQAMQQQQDQFTKQQAAAQTQQNYNAQIQALAAEKGADEVFEAANNLSGMFSPDLENAIMSSDKGAEIAVHLGTNINEALQLAQMQPTQAAIRIGYLQAQLSQPKPQAKASQAPAPIQSVSGGGTVSKDISDPSLSMKEYSALMNQKELARRTGN